jgi:hypothetical protein
LSTTPHFSKLWQVLAKKQKHLSDKELSELLYNHEPSDISEAEFNEDSGMNVDMSSGKAQTAN